MAEAALQAVIQEYITRKNYLQYEIGTLQDQKNLAVLSQADKQQLLSTRQRDCKAKWKDVYENDTTLQDKYKDYTEIPDFEEEIDKITAELQDEIEELTAWETAIDAQITTDSAEMEEIDAYLDSFKEMESSNISEDYDYGIGG